MSLRERCIFKCVKKRLKYFMPLGPLNKSLPFLAKLASKFKAFCSLSREDANSSQNGGKKFMSIHRRDIFRYFLPLSRMMLSRAGKVLHLLV